MDNHTIVAATTTAYLTTNDFHHRDESTRPILGFPLGTALLLLVIFCISAAFSCCYHWDKVRSLRRSAEDDVISSPDPDTTAATTTTTKSTPAHQVFSKQQCGTLPVLMPGDKFPKFVALPSSKSPMTEMALPPV